VTASPSPLRSSFSTHQSQRLCLLTAAALHPVTSPRGPPVGAGFPTPIDTPFAYALNVAIDPRSLSGDHDPRTVPAVAGVSHVACRETRVVPLATYVTTNQGGGTGTTPHAAVIPSATFRRWGGWRGQPRSQVDLRPQPIATEPPRSTAATTGLRSPSCCDNRTHPVRGGDPRVHPSGAPVRGGPPSSALPALPVSPSIEECFPASTSALPDPPAGAPAVHRLVVAVDHHPRGVLTHPTHPRAGHRRAPPDRQPR
jgi:hypothetical protein